MRFLCHTAHTPHLTIVTDFLSLQAHYSHPEILFSHLIEKKFSPHENTVPFMPFSLFSVRYAAQLRQRSFRTPLPTGIQGTKTHRQDPRMGPQPARARKRMRNGKRKIDRMARCERRKKKPEKMPRGKDNGSLCFEAIELINGKNQWTENILKQIQRKSLLTRLFFRRNRRGGQAPPCGIARRPFERGKDWGARMLFQQMR